MKRICVFTGANAGSRPEYAAAAQSFGRELVAGGLELVYGGGKVGLMGVIADAVIASGGKAIGVIPEALVAKEIAHRGLSELLVVASMHERKAMMSELSDAFVAMPGGLGTLEEFFEVLTWSQLGLHAKPCGILNVAHYYDPLLSFLDRAVEERFVKPQHRGIIVTGETPRELLERLASHHSVTVEKWIDRSST